MYKLSNRGWMKHFDFTVMDIIALEISFFAAYMLRFGWSPLTSDSIYLAIAIMLPIFNIFIVFFTEEYSGVLRRGYLKEFKEVCKHNSIILALLFLYMFATKQSEEYSRIVLFTMWIFSCLFVWVSRVILKKVIFHYALQEKNLSYLLVITVKNMAEQTIEKLQMNKLSQLSNDNSCSWYEFATEILKDKVIEVNPVTSEQYSQKAYRPKHSVMDLSKAKATGFEIPTWQEALDQFLGNI